MKYHFYRNKHLLLDALKEQKDKVRVGILEYNDFSNTPEALSLMQKEYPEIEVFLIHPFQATEKIIQNLDAVMMPGGYSHYPRNKLHVHKKDLHKSICSSSFMRRSNLPCHTPREMSYQRINAWVEKHQVPSMGICLGGQYLALHHGGSVSPINFAYRQKMNQGIVDAHFHKGTLPYLYTLSKEEQKHALKTCALPEISFKNIPASHSNRVDENLPSKIKLGAKSSDGMIQSISVKDRHTGFQFHFEADIVSKGDAVNPRYKNILHNFIHAAKQYHEAISHSYGSAYLRHKNLKKIADENSLFLNRMEECLSPMHSKLRGYKNRYESLPEEELPSLYSIPSFTEYPEILNLY